MGKGFGKKRSRALDYLKDAKKEIKERDQAAFERRGGGGDDDDWAEFEEHATSLEGMTGAVLGESDTDDEEGEQAAPKKKKKKKMKACNADGWWGHSRSFVQCQDAEAQVKFLLQATVSVDGEEDALAFPEDTMAGVGEFLRGQQECRDIMDLPRALKELVPDWPGNLKGEVSKKDLKKQHGSTGKTASSTAAAQKGLRVLVICGSAQRSVEVAKVLSDFKQPVGKLYAKHSHMPEQTKLLQEKDPRVAVGAPSRCSALVAKGSLHLDRLQLLVIDMYRDGKNADLFTQKQSRKDVMDFVYNHVVPNVPDIAGKIMLF